MFKNISQVFNIGHLKCIRDHQFYPVVSNFKCFNSSSVGFYETTDDADLQSPPKILKVSIIGPANVGKSTLINALADRRICSSSSKVHTTTSNAKAIVNIDNTQLIFMDTPGLLNAKDTEKFKPAHSMVVDPQLSVHETDLIAVVHDVSNKYNRHFIMPEVLKLLKDYYSKPSILIINKIDTLPKRSFLIDYVNKLTSKKVLNSKTLEKKAVDSMKCDKSWPFFSQVFLLSATKHLGVDKLRDFLLQNAYPAPWIFKEDVYTDQSTEDIVLKAVRETCLSQLKFNVPYDLRFEIDKIHVAESDTLIATVNIYAPNNSTYNAVLGRENERIVFMKRRVEILLQNTFRGDVNVDLVVQKRRKGLQNRKLEFVEQSFEKVETTTNSPNVITNVD